MKHSQTPENVLQPVYTRRAYLQSMVALVPPMLRRTVHGLPSAEETLVFVHGWPDDSRVWAPMLGYAPLAERYRCVTVDLPCFDGQAGWDPETLGFERLAEMVAAVIREESAGNPITLVGHDWGRSAIRAREHACRS